VASTLDDAPDWTSAAIGCDLRQQGRRGLPVLRREGRADGAQCRWLHLQGDPLVTIALEDKAGQVAWAAKRLGDAGVNIELFAPVDYGTDHKATIAIGVDKVEEARKALSDRLIDWKIPEKAFAGAMSS
jgi:hypothetical protein